MLCCRTAAHELPALGLVCKNKVKDFPLWLPSSSSGQLMDVRGHPQSCSAPHYTTDPASPGLGALPSASLGWIPAPSSHAWDHQLRFPERSREVAGLQARGSLEEQH